MDECIGEAAEDSGVGEGMDMEVLVELVGEREEEEEGEVRDEWSECGDEEVLEGIEDTHEDSGEVNEREVE